MRAWRARRRRGRGRPRPPRGGGAPGEEGTRGGGVEAPRRCRWSHPHGDGRAGHVGGSDGPARVCPRQRGCARSPAGAPPTAAPVGRLLQRGSGPSMSARACAQGRAHCACSRLSCSCSCCGTIGGDRPPHRRVAWCGRLLDAWAFCVAGSGAHGSTPPPPRRGGWVVPPPRWRRCERGVTTKGGGDDGRGRGEASSPSLGGGVVGRRDAAGLGRA